MPQQTPPNQPPADETLGSGVVAPTGIPQATELGVEGLVVAVGAEPTIHLRKRYLFAFIVAYFALYIAWIAPVAFSLAVRVEQLDAAGKNGAIALAIGVPSLVVLITGPLVGVLSDRTRLRLGRRRSWMLGGMIVGLLGSVAVGVATSVPLLIAAWTIAYVGYTAAGGMFLTHLGDKLPEAQRGRVAGFSGAVTQIAPIFGVAIASAFTGLPVLMFAVPAVVAFLLGLIFIAVMKDTPAPSDIGRIDMRGLLQGYWFDPRRHPNFAWVWISRCLIFIALSFSTLYTVYLLGERLQLDSATIGGLVATSGLLGLVVAIVGSVLSGTLSDRLRRRKPFIVVGGFLLAGGLVVTGTTTSVPQFFAGTLISVLGIGIFAAIDQAIGLDTLPSGEGQNGRFLGIFNLANQLAQGVGPFLAGAIVIAAGGDYMWVYLFAAAVAIIGGLLILRVQPGRPTTIERVPR